MKIRHLFYSILVYPVDTSFLVCILYHYFAVSISKCIKTDRRQDSHLSRHEIQTGIVTWTENCKRLNM